MCSFTLTGRASTILSNIYMVVKADRDRKRGTKVNGSHHGDNPLLKPTGIQIATKSLPGPTTREHRKLIRVKTVSVFGYELQVLQSGVLTVFQNLRFKEKSERI